MEAHHAEPEHRKCWQAAAMGAKTPKDTIPISLALYRGVLKGTGLRLMPRDEKNRKRFAHPMFPGTFLSIDEGAMIVEIAAGSESYIAQLASDLKLPRYRMD